jgi:hypothetical protein
VGDFTHLLGVIFSNDSEYKSIFVSLAAHVGASVAGARGGDLAISVANIAFLTL